MKISKPTIAAAILAAATLAVPTFAQNDPPGVAARVAFLSGNVSLEVQGSDQFGAAPLNYPMTSGDRIYVEPNGHAAIQIGSTDLRLWGGTDLTLTNLHEQYEQIGLAGGYLHVRVFAMQPGGTIEVDTPPGAVIIQTPGDYRITVFPRAQITTVVANSGSLQITGPGMNQQVDQGETVQLYGSDPAEIGLIDTPAPDAFDNWSMDRDRHILKSVSAQYVSHDMPGYDDLDDYGDWSPASDYGPIWIPRAMPSGWQPYTTGHWAYVAPWGYTWVDDAAWGYAPFHYGRWVQWQGRWGWVPGPPRVRPVYAPAFVAFVGGGPGFSLGVNVGGGGVAAWFPLGVAEPFVPWYHCSPAYVRTVNVSNVNIAVVRNVTIVNNYNVFINRVATVHSVEEIRVDNVTYVNRSHVFAVNASAMSSGARVQGAAIHLNVEQQQQLVRAQVSVARPPVPPPAHISVGIRANVSVAASRPVLMTSHGRVAATPAANTAHFSAASLPKPAPATAIRPATHVQPPNDRSAPAPANAGRPGQPANAPALRPGPPAVTRPGEPARAESAPSPRTATPPARTPATPPANHPAPETRPATSPGAHPAPETRPATPPAGHPAPETKPATPAAAHPAPGTKPTAPPAAHPAPETKPTTPQAAHPAPGAKTPPAKPEDKNKPKPEDKSKPKPKEENPPPQR
jgi:hypothetical protein